MLSLSIPILVLLLGLLLASWRSIKQLLEQQISSSKSLNKIDTPKLPPSPPKLPIIGHLHLVGSLPHRSFQELAKKYGPIMHLKLGSMPVNVISSPQMAERLLRNHDVLCAKRPMSQVSHDLSYGSKGIIFTPYSSYWKNVRKLCVMELLSASKIRSFAWLREEELSKLTSSLKDASAANQAVDIGASVGGVLEELIYRMLYGAPKNDDLALRAVVLEALRLSGTLNIADYLPFLAPFDPQGLKRRIKKLMKTVDDVLEKIINNHEDEARKEHRTHRDLVDVMLSLMTNNNNSSPSYGIERDGIKAILIDLVVPAIDSATNIVKWALASLLKHPEKMRKLQEEIEDVVGKREEKDLPKFKYIDLVIKEIFRLYPIIFAPHEAMQDITFDGYYVPKGSQIFLNSWAIGRDPNIWSDNCEEFHPERFLNNDIDIISGQDFRLAPLGFGRRRCPGTQLGLLNVKLLLSQLVHCFDWNMPDNSSSNDLVMQEKFGLVMSMANNLILIPKYRLNIA
ncbi:cytochrome P450 CYP736A12 [Beta vulgaris subsp. vulgaris]|uniref:cytochrome P450 CYP736A12 n=1 Tax=Beta vulgaris subsp. vulgaris TaxID=3555 RepID=UPI00254947DB|nr:cytochrome P450 CYP736A12 [Beta vulgaris subsp. vulgaris]